MNMLRIMKQLLRDRKGATVVEYAMLCALLSFAIMAAISGLASETNSMWSRVTTTMRTATNA